MKGPTAIIASIPLWAWILIGIVTLLGGSLLAYFMYRGKRNGKAAATTVGGGHLTRIYSVLPSWNILIRIVSGIAALIVIHLSIAMTFPDVYDMLWSDPRLWPAWYITHLSAGVILFLSWARNRHAITARFSDGATRLVASVAVFLIVTSLTLNFFSSGLGHEMKQRFTSSGPPSTASAAAPDVPGDVDERDSEQDHESTEPTPTDSGVYERVEGVTVFNDEWHYFDRSPDEEFEWRPDSWPVYVRYDDKQFLVHRADDGEWLFYRYNPSAPKGSRFERISTDQLNIKFVDRIGFKAPGTQPVRIHIGFARADLDQYPDSKKVTPLEHP